MVSTGQEGCESILIYAALQTHSDDWSSQRRSSSEKHNVVVALLYEVKVPEICSQNENVFGYILWLRVEMLFLWVFFFPK